RSLEPRAASEAIATDDRRTARRLATSARTVCARGVELSPDCRGAGSERRHGAHAADARSAVAEREDGSCSGEEAMKYEDNEFDALLKDSLKELREAEPRSGLE